MKKYKIWVYVEEIDHDAGCSVNREISNIGPDFTFLDQAMALKNSLVNVVSVIKEQIERDQAAVQHVKDCVQEELDRRSRNETKNQSSL